MWFMKFGHSLNIQNLRNGALLVWKKENPIPNSREIARDYF